MLVLFILVIFVSIDLLILMLQTIFLNMLLSVVNEEGEWDLGDGVLQQSFFFVLLLCLYDGLLRSCLPGEDLCDLVLILCVIVGILCVSGGPLTIVLSSVVVNEDATTLLDGNNGLAAAIVVALDGFTRIVLQK